MAKDEKKKGLFGKAIDAFSSRDEKEAAEKAKQAELEARKKASQARAQQMKVSKQASEAKAAAAEAEKRAKAAEEKLKKMEAEERKEKMMEQVRKTKEERDALIAKAAQPKFIAEHKLTADETLSHLSLKYYGSATRPYWMVIYEANKDVIGDNPAHVYPGLVVNIPELPAELKK
jgi:nucleoid-associated protein YgaU